MPVPRFAVGWLAWCVDEASLATINAMSSDRFAVLLLADYIRGWIVSVIESARWGVQCSCLLDSSR